MKNLLLISITLAAFIFGYFLIAKIDHFITENQHQIIRETRSKQSKIRIGAENLALLNSIGTTLESCSNTDPHISFFLSSGSAERILSKLLDDQIDIVLLSDKYPEEVGEKYSVLRIPYEKAASSIGLLGLPVENLDNSRWIRVVWKKSTESKKRDRIIFALENKYSQL